MKCLVRRSRLIPTVKPLSSEKSALTYSELHQRVDESASFLKNEFNVGKGDRVAVFLKNDDTFPIAFLAISKLGAISVVLNTRLTKPELAYQLEQTQPVAAIVDGETWDKGLDDLVKFKWESSSLRGIWGKGGTCPPAAGSEDDVHTILFTSGTTGKPKGVRIVHRNFIHSAIRLEQYMEMLGVTHPEEGRKTLIVAPLFHVMALQEQFLPSMRMGNTVVMLSALNITAFLELVEKERIDFLVGSPAIYRILLGSEDVKKYDLSSIKIAGFGAAPMSPGSDGGNEEGLCQCQILQRLRPHGSLDIAGRPGSGMHGKADLDRTPQSRLRSQDSG